MKNALKSIALALAVAVAFATTIVTSAGAFNWAAFSEEGIYAVLGGINLVAGFWSVYRIIAIARGKSIINPSDHEKDN